MFDKDDVLVVWAEIIILHSLQVCKFPNQNFLVYPSLTAKKKYSTTDLMKDLILDGVKVLDLEDMVKISGAGSASEEWYLGT